jgi:DNA-binding helix-hairpin-helix protein with protein kinase domain
VVGLVSPAAAIPWAVAVVCGLVWLWLEVARRVTEKRANADHERESAERHRIALAQHKVWEQEVAHQQSRARAEHAEAVRRCTELGAAVWAEADRRRQAAKEVRRRVQEAEHQYAMAAVRWGSEFDRKKGELEVHRDGHNELAQRYAAEREQLLARAREGQLRAFLQKVFIRDHRIPDIGPTRKATLASFGIETAFDVEHLRTRRVPGFGRKRKEQLFRWQRGEEARFVFNAATGIDPLEQRALDRQFAQARQLLENKLLVGERELRDIAQRAESGLRSLGQQVEACASQCAQADADLLNIPPGL